MTKVKSNKKLIVVGILLVIATICYFVHQIIGIHGDWLSIRWGNLLLTAIELICLGLYCFIFHKTKLNKLIYFLGFGAYGLLLAYYFVVDVILDFNFNIATMLDTLLLVSVIFFIATKVKPNYAITLFGTLILGIYGILGILHILLGYYTLPYLCYFVCELASFMLIWLNENTRKSKSISPQKTDIENTLVSLKHLYDSGAISEEEYSQKKADILNHF